MIYRIALSHSLWIALGRTMLHLFWVGGAIGIAAAILNLILRSARPELRYTSILFCLFLLTLSPAAILPIVYEPRFAVEAKNASEDDSSIGREYPLESNQRVIRSKSNYSFISSRDTAAVDRRSTLDEIANRLPWIWLIGSPGSLLMLVTGLVGVERLRRASREIAAEGIPERCRALADSLSITRKVGTAICDRLTSPVLIGVVRPLILLPPAALTGWNFDQLEMALLHELAHIKRYDNIVNVFQRFAESLLFFHPVVWRLSSQIRFERELCCDRIVVDRIGKPYEYAQMLATLVGSDRELDSAVLAMADRRISTRIRWILKIKERSMKSKLSEGIGLAGAAIVATTLALTAALLVQAREPSDNLAEAARTALRKASEKIKIDKNLPEFTIDMNMRSLVAIATAQFRIGDRDAAIKSLKQWFDSSCYINPINPDWNRFPGLIEIVELERSAGDLDAARASLARVEDLLKSIDPVKLDAPKPGVKAEIREEDLTPSYLCGMFLAVANERVEIGDFAEARALAHRTGEILDTIHRPIKAPVVTDHNTFANTNTIKCRVLGEIANVLYKTGDLASARAIIERTKRSALADNDAVQRDLALTEVADSYSQIGDIEGAITIVRSLDPKWKMRAMRSIVESMAIEDKSNSAHTPYLFEFMTGAERFTFVDHTIARRVLALIAAEAIEIKDDQNNHQFLPFIAELQAKAGDYQGAIHTSESIPIVKPADPNLTLISWSEAVRPATMAIIARQIADRGDGKSAIALMNRSSSLVHGIVSVNQKLNAQVWLSQKYAEIGATPESRRLLAEVDEQIKITDESMRSLFLRKVTEIQLMIGDVRSAIRTIDSMSDHRGAEKVEALRALAYAKVAEGDELLIKERLSKFLSTHPEKQKQSDDQPVRFVIPDGEIESFIDSNTQIDLLCVAAKVRVGDVDGAIRTVRDMAVITRFEGADELARALVKRGRFHEAITLADWFESRESRFLFLNRTANSIANFHKKQ